MVAMLRSCGDAPESSAFERTTNCWRTVLFQARSLLRTSCADAETAVGERLDAVEGQGVDVNDGGWLENVELHQIDERGASGDEGAAGTCCVLDGRVDGSGLRVAKDLHVGNSFRETLIQRLKRPSGLKPISFRLFSTRVKLFKAVEFFHKLFGRAQNGTTESTFG